MNRAPTTSLRAGAGREAIWSNGRGGIKRFLAAAVALAALAGCRQPVPAEDARWRAGRAEAVRAALSGDARATIAGLEFFPYDRALRLRAMLEPVTPEPLRMAASDGNVRPAFRVGRLHLAFPAGRATLAVYRLADVADPDHLFLPFRDALAGKETYGAGRYVEVAPLPGGVLEVDFNRAYNPDCAYGISAQCPIAPAENTLAFPVRAGERLPGGH